MAKKLKQIITLLALCSLIILSGCTQEKEFINEHNHRNIDFKEKSFKEALSLPLFNDALKKVAKQKGAFRSEDAARTALEDQYGFTIVADAPIRIITDENGTVFYTILIEREVKEELVFENLMMKVENNETTAAIFKYLMEGKGTISETGEYFFPNVESSEFTDLNVEGKVFYNSDTGEACVTTTQLMCNATWSGEPYNHIPNANCYVYGGSNGNNFSNLYESSSTVCFGSAGGDGGGTPDGSSNNTGGLGGSGGNNEPIDVTPIPCRTGNCIELDVILPDPCELINKLKNDVGFKLKMKVLKDSRDDGDNFETMIVLENKTIPSETDNYTYTTAEGNNFNPSPTYDFFTSTDGVLHNHYEELLSIFSMVDLADLYEKIKIPQISDSFFIALVTKRGDNYGVYIITIENRIKFLEFGDKYLKRDTRS